MVTPAVQSTAPNVCQNTKKPPGTPTAPAVGPIIVRTTGTNREMINALRMPKRASSRSVRSTAAVTWAPRVLARSRPPARRPSR